MEEIFKSLTNLIKKYDSFIIMSHKNMDLDGLGASLALSSIIQSFKKNCYIFMDRRPKNSSITKSLLKLKKNNLDTNFIYRTNYNTILSENNNTLLIILDTHKKQMIEYENILSKVKDVVILDHHIKNNNYIKDTILSYINSNVSSTIEIIVNYLKYKYNTDVNSSKTSNATIKIKPNTELFNVSEIIFNELFIASNVSLL